MLRDQLYNIVLDDVKSCNTIKDLLALTPPQLALTPPRGWISQRFAPQAKYSIERLR